jgi:type IV pilus assembly protein PilY1
MRFAMKNVKKPIALALSVWLLCFGGPPIWTVPQARADDSDIFGANIQPNVMFLIDSSQSMTDEVPSSPYNPSTLYTVGGYTYQPNQGAVYKYNSSSKTYSLYKNSISLVPNSDGSPSSAARDSLTSSGFWYGKIGGTQYYLFTGNYQNWKAAASASTEPKITIAKRVINNVIQNTSGVRFGAMKFRSGGGEVVAPVGTATSTLITAINNMTLTSVGTVLGEQIRDAGTYYKGSLGYSSPIQFECQPNFAIVVSDGLYTGTDPVQEAKKLYTQDWSTSFTGVQNIIVHTVGFGIAVSEPANELTANDALQKTATAGGGQFYSTTSATELEAALQDAIQQIVAATFSFATPVIPTTSSTGSTRAYLASFQSNPSRPFWRGFLKAFQRDANGNVPVDANGVPLDSALVWEAGQQLTGKSAASRTIFTIVSGSRVEFKTTTASITAAMLGVSISADRDKIINYIRGIDTIDENGNGNTTEERDWKLGDIAHSNPVLVPPPFQTIPLVDPAPTYKDFKAANANRVTVLIAGANDGMLHAFQERDGQELWTFIPNDLLSSLKTLTASSANHPFYVDGSPIAADVRISTPQDSQTKWRTIVVFGERRGGRFYHALDITDTTNPQYLWSFTDSKMGETWSEPVIGRVKMDPSTGSTEKYVAIVGGGYDTANNNTTGKAVFVIDLATGTKLFEYFNTGSASDDRRFMNFSLPANPTAVDINRDGFIDGVYIGDVGGQLWKFDLSPAATLTSGLVTNWTGKRLFAADPSQKNPPDAGEFYSKQAIYGAPVPALDKSNNLWIFFGTGDRNHPNNTTPPNRIYGIKDDTTMANGSPLTESNLANVSTSETTPTQGWFLLLGSNEKVLTAADVFNMIAFFSSFVPTTTGGCGTGGGTAKLYAVQMFTGYAALDWSSGVALTSIDASAARGKIIGTGIPSRPITIISESGATISTSVIVATTSQQLPSNPVPPPSAMRKVLYWREVF